MAGAQRAEARRLWLAALDQKAEFRPDSTLALLRSAIRADSSYFAAYHLYITEMAALGRYDDLRREFPEPPRTASVFAKCVSGAARYARGFDIPALQLVLRRLDDRPDPGGCRASIGARYRQFASREQSVAEVRDALAREPDADISLWWSYVERLNGLGRREEAVAVLHEGIRRSPHPLYSLALQLLLVGQRELTGDSAAARRLRTAIGASVARDGRPYLQWLYLESLANATGAAGDIVGMDSLLQKRVAIARHAGATVAELWSLYVLGWARLDLSSDPRAGVPPLTRAIALAEQTGSPYFRSLVYSRRGRALVKLGDFASAEQDMRKALAATAPNDAYGLAEAHQSLAQIYEGLGRWPEAVREADLFRGHARELRQTWSDSPMYMMSLRAGGMIRWKAGWHAAARESFERMVRVIDELGHSHYYAGEYYERIGDFHRAMTYYRRGATRNSSDDRPLNLAGLVRMYEALGMRDSARAVAERHDRPAYSHGTPRLLPAILLADGRVTEALELAGKDVEEQKAKKSALGTTSAMLARARLLLDAGREADAAREAATAGRLAVAATLTDEAIEALRVQGRAELRQRSVGSIATLQQARALVRSHPTASAELNVELALGDAYAAFGRTTDALAAYDRAATASQQVTATYESALDRARNRDQRMAPFDGALRMLLAMPESRERLEGLLSWSARKKDALFLGVGEAGEAGGFGGVGGAGGAGVTGLAGMPTGTRSTLTDVQRTLDDGTAIVDYLAVDGGIYALVVTARASRMVKLPLSVPVTTDLVQRLRRPFMAVDAGQLDLARTPFDLRLAHQLYAGLVAPFANSLGGVHRLLILPDGPLYGVPFDALPRTPPAEKAGPRAYHSADYLIDHFSITVSTSFVPKEAERRRGVEAGARVLVVHGPVPGGTREASSIVAAWPAGRATLISGTAATEGTVRRRMNGRSVVHFAVHAHADESDELDSFLELARDSSGDGFLHVTEIAALKYTGDLVVLTGCETIPGRFFAGTGPFGIANAFIAAGAHNVIATHWPVGESAAELSHYLHQALAGGAETSDALRLAQLRLRRDPVHAHPFYWGGYVVVAGVAR